MGARASSLRRSLGLKRRRGSRPCDFLGTLAGKSRAKWAQSGSVNESESLERGLVLAGLDALRQSRGDAVVRLILSRAAAPELSDGPEQAAGQVRIVDYLRYRDAALEYLGDSFNNVAFETGRALVRNLRHKKVEEVQALIARFDRGANKLAILGQAAVLAAKGNPGAVRAAMDGESRLLITIDKGPECRGLERETPFCFLNQGLVTEFAARHLGTRVVTEETACMALGSPFCRIEVTLVM